MMLRGEEPEREGILIRLPELSIGPIRLTQVGALAVAGGRGADTTLALMDWYSRKNAVSVLGWLGGNVFKAFRLTVDYQARMMYWSRQSEADTTELNQVGLTLRTAPRAVYVAAVATKNGLPAVDNVLPGDKCVLLLARPSRLSKSQDARNCSSPPLRHDTRPIAAHRAFERLHVLGYRHCAQVKQIRR